MKFRLTRTSGPAYKSGCPLTDGEMDATGIVPIRKDTESHWPEWFVDLDMEQVWRLQELVGPLILQNDYNGAEPVRCIEIYDDYRE